MEKLMKSDVFEKVEEAVQAFFDKQFDDMAGGDKFQAVVAAVMPIATDVGKLLLGAAVQMLYVKYSPKTPLK